MRDFSKDKIRVFVSLIMISLLLLSSCDKSTLTNQINSGGSADVSGGGGPEAGLPQRVSTEEHGETSLFENPHGWESSGVDAPGFANPAPGMEVPPPWPGPKKLGASSRNPWFLGGEEVLFCILKSGDFPVQEARLAELIQEAFEYWDGQFRLRVSAPKGLVSKLDGDPLRLGNNTYKQEACTSSTQVVFQFDYLEPVQKEYYIHIIETYSKSTTVRTGYDYENLKGRGFIYFKNDGEAKYLELWKRNNNIFLKALLIHEVGNTFGLKEKVGRELHGAATVTNATYVSKFYNVNLDQLDGYAIALEKVLTWPFFENGLLQVGSFMKFDSFKDSDIYNLLELKDNKLFVEFYGYFRDKIDVVLVEQGFTPSGVPVSMSRPKREVVGTIEPTSWTRLAEIETQYASQLFVLKPQQKVLNLDQLEEKPTEGEFIHFYPFESKEILVTGILVLKSGITKKVEYLQSGFQVMWLKVLD